VKFVPLGNSDARLIELVVHGDTRGSFTRTWCAASTSITCVHCAGMMYAAGRGTLAVTAAPVWKGSVISSGVWLYLIHMPPEMSLFSRVYS